MKIQNLWWFLFLSCVLLLACEGTDDGGMTDGDAPAVDGDVDDIDGDSDSSDSDADRDAEPDQEEELCQGVDGDGIIYEPNTYLHLPSSDNPDEGVGVADPHVILVDGTWYLYGTGPGDDYKVWTSSDLTNWSYSGVVWTPTAESWNDQGKIWAPHVEIGADGKYYLYYTANERIGIAIADDPTGPFEEIYDHPFVGNGHGDVDGKAIDAFVLRESDGTLTFFYTGITPYNMIYGRSMKDYVTLGDDPAVLLAEPIKPQLTSWEGFINEAPWVFVHNGRYFLSYSGNGADREWYAIGVAVADHPLGPYEKLLNNPILHQNPDTNLWGPGHHSIVPGVGCGLLLFYHSKLNQAKGYERKVRYIQVHMNDETGFELVGGHP